MIGIYAIRNTLNGKMYIGESINIEKRWDVHREDLDNGNHHSYKLQGDYDKSKNKEFRFFILEEFIFPFNAKIDSTKLQLILYCREYYYMKKYKSKSQGYNVEATLKEIMNIHNENLRYPEYQTEDCRNFIIENKDILVTDKFNLNILNDLCIYSEKDKLGSIIYINAESSPQRFNARYNSYTDKNGTLISKSKKSNDDDKTTIKPKPKRTYSQTKQLSKTPKPVKVDKDKSLIPRSELYDYLDVKYKETYSTTVLYFIDVHDGFLEYIKSTKKNTYKLTSKAIDSGYFISGDPYINGYNKDQILLTPLGLDRYKDITNNITSYLPSNMVLEINQFGKLTIPIEKV